MKSLKQVFASAVVALPVAAFITLTGATGASAVISCPVGFVPVVAGNGAELCAVDNTQVPGGGGGVVVGPGNGQGTPSAPVIPVAPANPVAPVAPAPYVPPAAPYVPPTQTYNPPAPVYNPPATNPGYVAPSTAVDSNNYVAPAQIPDTVAAPVDAPEVSESATQIEETTDSSAEVKTQEKVDKTTSTTESQESSTVAEKEEKGEASTSTVADESVDSESASSVSPLQWLWFVTGGLLIATSTAVILQTVKTRRSVTSDEPVLEDTH